jgi:hypothetical protein
MNWKGFGRKRTWRNSWYYPDICLEGLRETKKNLSRDSRSPARDLNPGPVEYEAGVLPTPLRRPVTVSNFASFVSLATELSHASLDWGSGNVKRMELTVKV